MKKAMGVAHNDRGLVLVLSMFMLALLTMIGMASMMTTTTEVEIAGNERSYMQSYYNAQTGLHLASHVVRDVGGMEGVALTDYGDNESTLITTVNPFFMAEDEEARRFKYGGGILAALGIPKPDRLSEYSAKYARINVDNQTDSFDPLQFGAGSPTAEMHDIEFRSAHVGAADVDPLGAYTPGGEGAEFGAGYGGRGSTGRCMVLEIQSHGFHPANPGRSVRNIVGYKLVIDR